LKKRSALFDAAADIAGRCRILISAGRHRTAVEQDAKLIGNSEIGGAPPMVVDQACDVPFVV